MVCLDTDIIIAFLHGDKEAIDKINNLSKFGIQLSTTPLNICELYIGAYKSNNHQKNVKLIDEFLESIVCLDFNSQPCKLIGFLASKLMNKGKFIGERDILIAGIALIHDEVLVTKNVKHFKMIDGLKIEKW